MRKSFRVHQIRLEIAVDTSSTARRWSNFIFFHQNAGKPKFHTSNSILSTTVHIFLLSSLIVHKSKWWKLTNVNRFQIYAMAKIKNFFPFSLPPFCTKQPKFFYNTIYNDPNANTEQKINNNEKMCNRSRRNNRTKKIVFLYVYFVQISRDLISSLTKAN